MSVTLAMIVISVAIYVIINFIDHSDEKSALAIKYGAFYPPKIEYKQEYWRFLTANFVHVDLVHIFMNCYALYYLGGTFFEPFLGSLEYLYLVLISGIFSYLITYMASKRGTLSKYDYFRCKWYFLWVFRSYCDFRCCFSRTIFNGFKTIYSCHCY